MSTLWNGIMLKSEHDSLIIKNQQEQIDALKAQVNRFKRGVESFNKTGSMNELLSAYIETPEHCLAEVKAKAIEDATLRADDGSGWCFEGDLSRFAKTLREQAK